MKRILFIVAISLIALAGFTFFTGAGHAEAHDDHDGHNHDEEIDFDNIPLTQKQISTIDLRMGEVQHR